jgi:hypothetical protein
MTMKHASYRRLTLHSRQARYGVRAPRPLLSRGRREDEAGQGGADAHVRCVLIELPRRGIPQSGVRQVAQRDYVVGGSAEKADSGAHQWNGNVIACTAKRSSTLTPASCQKTEPVCRQKVFCWCILQPITLQVENVQEARIAGQCRSGQRLAFAARPCLDDRQEACGGIAVEVGEAAIALTGHPSNQHAQMLKRTYKRPVPRTSMAGRRIDA